MNFCAGYFLSCYCFWCCWSICIEGLSYRQADGPRVIFRHATLKTQLGNAFAKTFFSANLFNWGHQVSIVEDKRRVLESEIFALDCKCCPCFLKAGWFDCYFGCFSLLFVPTQQKEALAKVRKVGGSEIDIGIYFDRKARKGFQNNKIFKSCCLALKDPLVQVKDVQ